MQVQEGLRDRSLFNNPSLCAEYRAQLSGEYTFVDAQLEEIIIRKPFVWQELRKLNKSDASTDRAYETTEDGIEEIKLSGKLKRMAKLMSGLSSLIKLAENTAHNQF